MRVNRISIWPRLAKVLEFLFSSSLTHFLTYSLLVTLTLGASSYFPEFYHVFTPSVGGWSTYRITDSKGDSADLTFAVVAEERGQYWLELRSVQEGSKAVASFLVKGDPTDDANVLAVRVQDQGGPAMEINKFTLDKLKARGQSAFGGSALPIGPKMESSRACRTRASRWPASPSSAATSKSLGPTNKPRKFG